METSERKEEVLKPSNLAGHVATLLHLTVGSDSKYISVRDLSSFCWEETARPALEDPGNGAAHD